MSCNPLPIFKDWDKYQSLSTKKERKRYFQDSALPPKTPIRSCPVSRIRRSIFNEEPQPVSFREDSDTTFISESSYCVNRGTYFDQAFVIEKALGKGSFGEVFKVRHTESGLSYACKKTLLKYRGKCDRGRRLEEVKKHEQVFAHRNTVRFYRAWEECNHLYLLTEVCKCSLADLTQEVHEFSESQLWSFLVDILQGLDHLHRSKLIHMDVKPENIFVGYDGFCKLGDFGLVVDFSDGYPSDVIEGDPRYLAPECFQSIYTPAADLFSLGMVMLELATDLFLPMSGRLWHQLRQGKDIPGLAEKALSEEFKEVIFGLLQPDYERRLSASRALAFPSVSKEVWKKDWIHFFRTKTWSLTSRIRSVLVWPFVSLLLVVSLVSRRVLDFRIASGKLWRLGRSSEPQPPPPPEDCTPNDSFEDFQKILKRENGRNRSRVSPLISTPLSCLKRRKGTAPSNSFSSDDEDDVDGKGFVFEGSSFSSLDISREEMDGIAPPSPLSSFAERGSSTPRVRERELLSSSHRERPRASPSPSAHQPAPVKSLLELFDSADVEEDLEE